MRYNIITIEREYASGGSEIGRKLAEKLAIPCYGQKILELVAEDAGTTPEQIQHMEEKATSSLLYSLAMMTKIAAGQADGLSQETQLYLAEAKIITKMAEQGPCIIVGRCASWVLKERKDVLNVYIHADWETRKKRAVELYHDSPEKVESVLKRCDKRRSAYYSANTGKHWDGKENYHLVLDSGKLGIDKCVEIISESAR